jgi:hypothetical protein
VKGTPDDPMSRREVVDKALDLVEPHLGKDLARDLIETTLNVEKLDGLSRLRPLLQG